MPSNESILKIHPSDNVAVALTDLRKGETVKLNDTGYLLINDIPAKHKFMLSDVSQEGEIIMYGVLVGKAMQPIQKGGLITTQNIRHAAGGYGLKERKTTWHRPDISNWKERTFMGYHRADGAVGT